jgi:hypothetical protein
MFKPIGGLQAHFLFVPFANWQYAANDDVMYQPQRN